MLKGMIGYKDMVTYVITNETNKNFVLIEMLIFTAFMLHSN